MRTFIRAMAILTGYFLSFLSCMAEPLEPAPLPTPDSGVVRDAGYDATADMSSCWGAAPPWWCDWMPGWYDGGMSE